MRILLTGATGFIGSNIAWKLVNDSYTVYATCRNSSGFERCSAFKDRICWINTDYADWRDKIKKFAPDLMIHSAWDGIKDSDRNNWDLQLSNFFLSRSFFDLAKECGIKKIVAFGSQDEYGDNKLPVKEETYRVPKDAYGTVKILTSNYLRILFENSETQWYWIRIFAIFGEGQEDDWLLPCVISRLLKNEHVPLTPCEQEYNYLYIQDFVNLLNSVITCKTNKSGIYNLCDSESFPLRKFLLEVADLVGASRNLLDFGAKPYRYNQSMLISGNNAKFRENFSVDEQSLVGLKNGLARTIEYYRNK